MVEYKHPRVPETLQLLEVKMYAELMLKICSTCKIEKTPSEFYGRKISPDGLAYICKECDDRRHVEYRNANKALLAEKQKQWRDNNKSHIRAIKRKSKFGINKEEQDAMLESQNHCCAICNKHESKCRRVLAIDHDHRTNKIRGLLCDNCNRCLGLLKDDLQVLESAVKYLKKYQK